VPQIDFAIGENEESPLVELILGSGLHFVPDKPYRTANPVIWRDLASVERALRTQRSYFLILPGVSGPFEMWQCDGGVYEGKYFIMQRNGGPYLDILFPIFSRAADGQHQFAAGFIGYYKTYWDPGTSTNLPIPKELLDRYRYFCKEIRSRTSRFKIGRRTYHFSTGILHQVRSGALKQVG
jgi:hypothetical protein